MYILLNPPTYLPTRLVLYLSFQMMPILLRKLAEFDTIVERPRLACKLAELLQAVLEWDQLKVSTSSHFDSYGVLAASPVMY